MAFWSALLRTKSTRFALFSALVVDSARCCASIVHPLTRLGSQPLPMRKRTNLNVSVSPIGFFQNMSRITLGHDFNGKKASISPVNCLLSSTTSARDSKQISPRYRLNVAIMHPFEKCTMKAAILHHRVQIVLLSITILSPSLDRKVDFLFNAIAQAIVSKFAANNRPESIEPVPINTIISRSLPVVRFAVTLA